MQVSRVNEGFLSGLERPALNWMAPRVPLRISPDHLTIIGLSGAVAAAAGYILSRWSIEWLWLAIGGLIVNWAGDSLDGNVARARGHERHRYGFFIDHTTDLFSQALIFFALAASPCTRFAVAATALIAFLMGFVYTLIYFRVTNTMRITYFRFGPTEIRALLVLGNLITLLAGVLDLGQFLPWLERFGAVTIYEVFIVLICAISVPAFALLAIRESRVLARDDPPPASASGAASEPHFQPATAALPAEGI
jgi:archaetidylinositol phosphate synthase